MDKIAAGRARKEDKKNAARAAEDAERQAAEDASWEDGAKKVNKKKEAEAEKAAAKAARKAEVDAEAAAEEAAFAEKKRTGKSAVNKPGGAKMTRAEIAAKIMKQQELFPLASRVQCHGARNNGVAPSMAFFTK